MIVNRIILNDGTERRNVSLDDVRRLYTEKQVDKATLVQHNADGKWLPLQTVFDTAQWDAEERRFRAIRGDGEELEVNMPELRDLYLRGDLRPDSRVFENSDQRWLPLSQRFDVASWLAAAEATRHVHDQGPSDDIAEIEPAGAGKSENPEPPAEPVLNSPEETGAPQQTPETSDGSAIDADAPAIAAVLHARDEDKKRREWASWLLFLSSALDLAWLAFAKAEGFVLLNESVTTGATIWNIVVAFGLRKGGDGWRTFACFRAVIGILFGLSYALDLSSRSKLWYGCFNILWCVGFLILLLGVGASQRRRKIGAGMIVTAQLTILAVSLLSTVLPEYRMRATIRNYSLLDGAVSDEKLGYAIQVPTGWTVLRKDNPIVQLPDAKMIAVNVRSGAFAAFLAEPALAGIRSADQYLDQVEQGMKQSGVGLKELGRFDTLLDGHGGRKADVSWHESGEDYEGSFTVVRQGWFYYSLRGWSTMTFKDRGAEALTELQSAVRISNNASDQFGAAFIKGMQEKNSLISDNAGAEILRVALARGSTIMEIKDLLEAGVERGRAALSKPEQGELDRLYSLAFSALPPEDNRALLAYYAKIDAGTKPNQAEAQNADALVMKGVSALPVSTRARFQDLFSKMLELGLARLE